VIEPPHSIENAGTENRVPVGWVVVVVVVVDVVEVSVVSCDVVVSVVVVVVVSCSSHPERVSVPASPVYSTEAEVGG